MKIKTNLRINAALILFAMLTIQSGLFAQQETELQLSMTRGKVLYEKTCSGCHKLDGTGYVENRLTPPLAGSDYLLKNKVNSIKAVLFGLSGAIVVNDLEYNRQMPPIKKTEKEIADILNYVRNSWGNKGEMISKEDVKRVKDQ